MLMSWSTLLNILFPVTPEKEMPFDLSKENEEKDQAQRPQNGRPSLEAESMISLLSPSAACAAFGVLRFCLKFSIPSASVFGFRVSFVSNGDFNFTGIGADAYWLRPAVSRYTFIDSEHKNSI